MTKRAKFILTSLLLSLGFIAVNLGLSQYRFTGIGLLSLATILLFAWSLREGLGLNATLFVLILPALFTLGVGLFWFLLPATLFTWIPVVILYGIGMYALNLTMNIFTVSAIRTIALSRAAKSVGFVMTLFTSFLLFDAVLSIRSSLLVTTLVVFVTSFTLFIQGLWTGRLTRSFKGDFAIQSVIFSYFLTIVSVLLHFWPVTVIVGSIFLTVGTYILLGLGQAEQEGRLFRQTVREYLGFGIAVFIIMFLVTSWRG